MAKGRRRPKSQRALARVRDAPVRLVVYLFPNQVAWLLDEVHGRDSRMGRAVSGLIRVAIDQMRERSGAVCDSIGWTGAFPDEVRRDRPQRRRRRRARRAQ